ncbi:MAG TPA: 1-deoxy-D-xylulose-5-phosphate synthase [bacterium]|nr:1-deoxy-D-xylulose-5-phosphate synthase [bacterium]
MSKIFDRVNLPKDIKSLSSDELVQLAGELRAYVIDEISRIGGHLAPSLGVVEISVALHHVFDTPTDKVIWDVGHQAYVHKLLTGRKDQFHTIRQTDGISGFCKIHESEYDAFGAGHASTSISAAVGMAIARDQLKKNNKVVAVIGDGSLTGGMAFEAMNNAGSLKTDMIVVLNDNMMSISSNVGALSNYLTDLISAPLYNKVKTEVWNALGHLHEVGDRVRHGLSKMDESIKSMLVPGHFFESLGFRYFGPIDGHDLPRLIKVLRDVKDLKGPILIHTLTKKGKGMPLEEQDVEKYKVNANKFHAVSPPKKASASETVAAPTYTEVFGKTVVKLCKMHSHAVGITAAMADGTGLKFLAKEMPERFFDVGIAEQHAVTMAAAMSLNGVKPIVAIYSTFLQRAYDQIVHDVAIQKIPVLFCLDRAGLVGADGPTHHGALDLSYLRCIQGMVIMAPKDENELKDMVYTGLMYDKGPIAVRFPRGNGIGVTVTETFEKIPIGQSEFVQRGKDIALLAVGNMVQHALSAAQELLRNGYSATVVNIRFVKPLDEAMLFEICRDFDDVITIEDNVTTGGFGSGVLETIYSPDFIERGQKQDKDFVQKMARLRIKRLGLPDAIVEHGDNDVLYERVGLDPASIARDAKTMIEKRRGGIQVETIMAAAAR